MDFRIISIGALSGHELWGEKSATRTAHATTTLIRSNGRVILVDPGLPPDVIAARLKERTGLNAADVTDVFLTNFRPAHRWGLAAFSNARWMISEMEREVVGTRLIGRLRDAETEGADDMVKLITEDIAILQRCEVPPDRIVDQVDLFPLPGFTPGNCGLLLLQTNSTTLVAGDAVPTVEHVEQGQVMRGGFDLDQARESFMEAIEIADVIIPGHDNLLLNPTRRPM